MVTGKMEVLLEVGGFDMDGGMEMTMTEAHIDVQKCDFGWRYASLYILFHFLQSRVLNIFLCHLIFFYTFSFASSVSCIYSKFSPIVLQSINSDFKLSHIILTFIFPVTLARSFALIFSVYSHFLSSFEVLSIQSI